MAKETQTQIDARKDGIRHCEGNIRISLSAYPNTLLMANKYMKYLENSVFISKAEHVPTKLEERLTSSELKEFRELISRRRGLLIAIGRQEVELEDQAKLNTRD